MDLSGLKWDAAGLVTVVVQDRLTGEIRMLAHANEEAVRKTLDVGEAHFYSRSREALWHKGETSGHTLAVSEVWVDCDADALLYLAEPHGPSCHTGRTTCFFRKLPDDVEEAFHGAPFLATLGEELERRREASGDQSYTKSLLEKGFPKIGEKLREEADELAHAVIAESDDRVASEAADVLYHVMVALLSRGLSLRDVQAELARRFGVSGHEEKASR